jgi:6-phosphogluconolactonase (cycloisomerase 2 family)
MTFRWRVSARASGWVVAAILTWGAGLLSGCATPTPGVTINYRQIGVCDGTGGVKAGPNAAFVLYQLDTIANQSSTTSFAFDPTRFSANGPQAASIPLTFITNTPILGDLGVSPAKTATAGPGQVLGLPPSAYGLATVAGPASQANGTRYFLIYASTVNDPPVIPVLIDLARTAWPYTSDCAGIGTNLGQYAYVLDGAGANVLTLKIDPSTGVLTDLHKPVSAVHVSGDQNRGTFVADPRGRFLFGIDVTSGKLLTFKINSDGSLSAPTESAAVPGPYPNVPAFPFALAIDPAGRFIYVQTGFGVAAYSYDANAGTPTFVSNTPMDGTLESLVVDGSGSFLYVLASPITGETLTAYAITPSSGTLSPVGTVSTGGAGGLNSMTMSPLNGYLYFYDSINRNVRVFAFSPTTLKFTQPVGPTSFPNGAYGLTFDGSGGFLYVETGASGPSAYSVSSTGALQPLAAPSSQNPAGIYAEPTGRFIYFQDDIQLTLTGYKLDPNSGTLTQMPGAPLFVSTRNPLTIPGTY